MLSIKIISGESTPYDHILKEYPTLTRPAVTLRNVSHSTVHHIRTTPGPSVFCRPRRIAPERIKIAKAEFEAIVLEGTARDVAMDHGRPHSISYPRRKTSVTFLGYQVSSEGTRPLPDHIADLQNLPVPKVARDLRRFLGMVNFYRRFLPSAAKYQSSLNDALSGLRGAQLVTWTSELNTAFSKCKEALSEVTLLTHPAPDVPLGLFYGCFCSPRWSNTDATCRCAVQHFRHVLEAQHCTIYTYHKPVTYAFLHRQKLPPVQLNQLSFIGQFTTDIQHISGAKNVVADAFFRISYIAPPPVDLKAIAEAQKGDTELLHLQTSDNSLKLEKNRSSWFQCDTHMRHFYAKTQTFCSHF
ncbi:retrovirus-related Pol polyprotein from transposon 17.6 [Trichonephila clavipes]|nr:retrovirus-related Pol polyprotein from transposon 17.6 [Trichonephila clavipes]